jgi:hypothetical protein
VNAVPIARALITPARPEFHRANDSSRADDKTPIGADCPKSSSVTAYDAEWMQSSPIDASLLRTAVCRMPPAQKPITLTFSAPVTSHTESTASRMRWA